MITSKLWTQAIACVHSLRLVSFYLLKLQTGTGYVGCKHMAALLISLVRNFN